MFRIFVEQNARVMTDQQTQDVFDTLINWYLGRNSEKIVMLIDGRWKDLLREACDAQNQFIASVVVSDKAVDAVCQFVAPKIQQAVRAERDKEVTRASDRNQCIRDLYKSLESDATSPPQA